MTTQRMVNVIADVVTIGAKIKTLETENAELKAKVEELKRDLDRVLPERDELRKQLHRQGNEYTEACHDLAVQRDELRRQLAESKANHRELAETSIRIHAAIQAENAELKRQLAEGPVCGPCEHKRARAFLERQIAEGELIPFDVIMEWGGSPLINLQEFAKRKAAQ